MSDISTTDTEPVLTDQKREKLKARHDELSRDIRKTAMVLLTYCFFCFLTLGQSDEVIVSATAMLQIPFANTEISPRTFLWAGPLILILLSAYLHVFIREHSKITSLDSTDKLPYIFNLESWFAKGLTAFTFYVLPCIIMLAFAERVFPRPDRENWFILAGLMCGSLLWFFILNKNLFSFNFWSRVNGFVLAVLIIFMIPISLITLFMDDREALAYFFLISIVLWVLMKGFNIFGIIKSRFWKKAEGKKRSRLLLRVNGFLSGVLVLGGCLLMMSYLFEDNDDPDQTMIWAAMGVLVIFWVFNGMISFFSKNSYDRWGFLYRFSATVMVVYFGTAIFYSVMIDSPLKLNLRGAELVRHDLQGYFLGNADLQGAHLNEANLQGTELKSANLKGAKLQGANLQNAKLQGANLQGTKLKDVKLQGSKLQGANLQEIDFRGIDLSGFNLQGTKLQKANLEEVNLRTASLQYSQLEGAKLKGAKLLYADLRNVKGLSLDQVKMAEAWNSSLYDNKFRKELGITDDQQIQLIENYIKNNEWKPKNRKKKVQDLLLFYGLSVPKENTTPPN